MIDARPAPPPLGSPGYMLVKNFDASTTCVAPARLRGEESPRIFSEWPLV